MTSETNDNQVSAAFDYILNELPKSCFSLVKEMSVAADLGENASVIVPGRYHLCSPTLQALRTLGGQGWNGDIAQTLIEQMQLSEEVIQQPHKGGDPSQTELESELGWARSTLRTCGMIDSTQQAFWQLTESGFHQKELTPAEWEILWRRRHQQRRQRGN